MGKGLELALEAISNWGLFEEEAFLADDGLGEASATCPSCGYTGQMDHPKGSMPGDSDPTNAGADSEDS